MIIKNKKLFYFGIGLLFIIVLISGFLIFNKGPTKYFLCFDNYIISCFDDSEKIKNISCSNNQDCSVENMHAYCSPGYFDQLESPFARYYCGDEGYCKGCNCGLFGIFIRNPQVPKKEIKKIEEKTEVAVLKELPDSDLEKCDKINNLYGHKDECYADIAVDKQDSVICAKIREPIYRNWCFKTIEKKYITPEETVCGFFHWYLHYRRLEGSLEERDDVTKEYKRKISQISQEMTGPGYDPIIFAQDIPGRFITGREEQIEKTASVIVNLEYNVYPHILKVELLSIGRYGQWKINDIYEIKYKDLD